MFHIKNLKKRERERERERETQELENRKGSLGHRNLDSIPM